MPQMSPIWWVSLFFMFIFIFMVFNFLVYFSIKYKYNLSMMINVKDFNWLW